MKTDTAPYHCDLVIHIWPPNQTVHSRARRSASFPAVKLIFTFVAVVLGLALARQLNYTVEEVVRKEHDKASCGGGLLPVVLSWAMSMASCWIWNSETLDGLDAGAGRFSQGERGHWGHTVQGEYQGRAQQHFLGVAQPGQGAVQAIQLSLYDGQDADGEEKMVMIGTLLPCLPTYREAHPSRAATCYLFFHLSGIPREPSSWMVEEQSLIWSNILLLLEAGRPPLPEASLTAKYELG